MCNEKQALIYSIRIIEAELLQKRNGCSGCNYISNTYALYTLGSTIHFDQLETWSIEMLKSYASDLTSAIADHRNPFCERLAYGMQETESERFELLSDHLPPICTEKQWLVDLLCANSEHRQNACAAGYTMGEFRSELMTYSVETLRAYAAYLDDLHEI